MEVGRGDGCVATAVPSASAGPRRYGPWLDLGSEFHGELWWRGRGCYTAAGRDDHPTHCFEHKSSGERIDDSQCHSKRRNARRKCAVSRRWVSSRRPGAGQQRNDRQYHGNVSQLADVLAHCGDALRQRTLPGKRNYTGIAVGNVERYRYRDDILGHHRNISSDGRYWKHQPDD